MNKVCCCNGEPELPDISVHVTCACCESRVEEHSVTDMSDLDIATEKAEEVEKEDVVCCCFHRKRHAKSKKRKDQGHDGAKA